MSIQMTKLYQEDIAVLRVVSSNNSLIPSLSDIGGNGVIMDSIHSHDKIANAKI